MFAEVFFKGRAFLKWFLIRVLNHVASKLNKTKRAGNKKIQWDIGIQVMNHCPINILESCVHSLVSMVSWSQW